MKTKSLKRKRGISIEIAILMLLVVFALSSMLVTVSMQFKAEANNNYKAMTREIEYDRLGDAYIIAVRNNTVSSFTNANLNVTSKGPAQTGVSGVYQLDVYTDSAKTIHVLTVRYDKNNSKIIKWIYN